MTAQQQLDLGVLNNNLSQACRIAYSRKSVRNQTMLAPNSLLDSWQFLLRSSAVSMRVALDNGLSWIGQPSKRKPQHSLRWSISLFDTRSLWS